jgi:type II secretory pathway component PulK
MTRNRAGAAIVMVLVAMAVASVLMASQASMIIARQRMARQARSKVQAQWLAESALDRARLQPRRATEVWRPEVSPANLPPQEATVRLETDEDGASKLVVIARVGKEMSPTAAQHTLRELLSEETKP